MMEKKAKALFQVAPSALVQREELIRVQKTELKDIAEERGVAGSQFEGVGCLASHEFLPSHNGHGITTKLYAKATPSPRPPFVLSRYLFPRTPPHDKQKETTGQTKGGRGTGAAPATAERSGGQQAVAE